MDKVFGDSIEQGALLSKSSTLVFKNGDYCFMPTFWAARS